MAEAQHEAEFRFYAELNDFLPQQRRQRSFSYVFRGHPAVKDAIEAMGVPHTEVDLILANQISVDFDYQLQAHDRVAVYPVFESFEIGPINRLRPRPLRDPKFVCDVHLGKLARRLRWLGFDTTYENTAADCDLADAALAEQRIILTRDRGLLKLRRVTHGYFIRSQQADQQVIEVLHRFDLFSRADPLSRCIACNGRIRMVEKMTVQDSLPPRTRRYYDEFFQCETCGKVYWKGSHVSRLEAYIQKLRSVARSAE